MVVIQDKTKLSVIEISYLSICCLLLLTPLVYSTKIPLGVLSFKFFYLFFLTCAASLAAIVQIIKVPFSCNKVDIVAACLFLYLVCDVLWIGKPAGFVSEQGEKIITFFCAICVYFSVRIFTQKEHVRRYLYIIASMSFLGIIIFECLFVCLQKFSLLPGLSNDLRIKVTGTFSHPAMLGGILALIIPFLYSELRNFKSRQSAVIGIGVITLLLSGSRAAFLAVVAGCLYSEFIKHNIVAYLKAHRKVLVAGVTGLAVFLIVLINIRTVSVFGRMLAWKICWPMVGDAPVFGHGLGTFRDIYPAYQMDYFLDPGNAADKRLADFILYVYNEFLQVWIEMGLVGLALFVLMIVFCLFGKQSGIEERGAKAAILAFVIFSLFSYPFSLSFMVLYFFFFLSISGNYTAIMPGKAVAALAIIAPLFFIQPVWSKWVAYGQLSGSESGEVYSGQYNVLRNDNNYLSRYAGILNEAGNQQLGLEILQKKKGLSYLDYLLIGDMHSNRGRSDSAILYYEKARLLLPNSDQPVQRIANERALMQRFNP